MLVGGASVLREREKEKENLPYCNCSDTLQSIAVGDSKKLSGIGRYKMPTTCVKFKFSYS